MGGGRGGGRRGFGWLWQPNIGRGKGEGISRHREGMGLLEYQAMPSLRYAGHDGVLCTFSNRSVPDRGKWCGSSVQVAWTVHHVQNHTLLGHSPPEPGGPPCWASPVAFGLIKQNVLTLSIILCGI